MPSRGRSARTAQRYRPRPSWYLYTPIRSRRDECRIRPSAAATVTPLPGEAAGQVVVHQAAGLHRGVRGDRPSEDEAMLAQLAGQRLRGGDLRREVGKRARRRARRIRVGVAPDQVAEPGRQLERGPGVRDHGADLRPVPDDARVGQQALLVGRPERGYRRDVEAREGAAEVFPLPQDRQPRQPRLETLAAHPFEDHFVTADRAPPFGVVVGDVLRGAEPPGAAQPPVGAGNPLASRGLSHGTAPAAPPDRGPRRAMAGLRPRARPRGRRSPLARPGGRGGSRRRPSPAPPGGRTPVTRPSPPTMWSRPGARSPADAPRPPGASGTPGAPRLPESFPAAGRA